MSRLRDLALQAASSLWFLPLGMVVALGGLAFVMVAFDAYLDRDTSRNLELARTMPLLFGAGIDGARSMLSTMAAALVTVAGVTLSGVLVALSLTASQFTSRVLRSFTANRVHQASLGLILGSFVYSLIVLRSIGAGPQGAFLPQLAVSGAVGLTFLSVAALLAFAHGVARAVQASELLAATARETEDSARNAFQHSGECGEASDSAGNAHSEDDIGLPPERAGVKIGSSGYLREVDAEALVTLAEEADGIIIVEKLVGDFLVEGEVAASLAGGRGPMEPELAERILACLRIGSFRTAEQDPAFGVRQIVDIGLRALSPGINDPTTAEMALHRLVQVLRVPARSPARPSRIYSAGMLRVVSPRHEFEGLLRLAYEQLLRAAEDSPRVLATMMEGWVQLRAAALDSPVAQRSAAAVESFAAEIEEWVTEQAVKWPPLHDCKRIEAALARLRRYAA